MTDAELIKFATEFREGILNGRLSTFMCAMVCWPLETLLNLEGVSVKAMMSDGVLMDLRDGRKGTCNHVWLKLADGRVLDPTADQFNGTIKKKMPKVYLGKPIKYLHRENASQHPGWYSSAKPQAKAHSLTAGGK